MDQCCTINNNKKDCPPRSSPTSLSSSAPVHPPPSSSSSSSSTTTTSGGTTVSTASVNINSGSTTSRTPLSARSNSSVNLSSLPIQPSFNRMSSLGSFSASKSSSSIPPPARIHMLQQAHEEFMKPIFDFAKHIQSETTLREEFYALEDICQSSSSHQTIEGNLKHNTSKNRYTNILPCDTTRVKLEKINGQEGSDYINANFIDGEVDRQYICTQGPLQNTIVDFWRMVWENSSSIIVMLSKELENCRIKCDRYWSDFDPIIYEQFIVALEKIEKDIDREIIVRTFKLTNQAVNQSRIITHYQYEGWPDHNAPNDTEPLRHLLHLINTTQNSLVSPHKEAPIVVHCSAGVGRTGTFCTVHTLMKRIDNAKPNTKIDFNIYSIVNNLRKQRPGMVQQLEQYLFCYATIDDELKKRTNELK